jgi:hypothetical protein
MLLLLAFTLTRSATSGSAMYRNIVEKLKDWSIPLVGAPLVTGGLYLVSTEGLEDEENLIRPAQFSTEL